MTTVFVNSNNIQLSFVSIIHDDWVVIKPNLVKESNENDPEEWLSVITSSKLIRNVTEHVCMQLKGTGKISICDAPQTDSDFRKIIERLGLFEMANDLTAKYGTPIEILDLRNEAWVNEGGVIIKREKIKGDPNGSVCYDLAEKSLFYNHYGEGRYYGADYDFKSLNEHHNKGKHEYLLCATPLMADVFINLPKLKTHKKAGVTLSLKNLVGINADKNWLPHHTFGAPSKGGDEYPESTLKRTIESSGSRLIKRIAFSTPFLGPKIARYFRNRATAIFGNSSSTIRSGNWYGNNTTWRMVLDLNRCFLFGNPDGTLRDNNPKRYYTIIDGEIGMEGNGPMQGTPKKCGVYIGGTDPVAVDAVGATIMGYDWKKIPIISEAFNLKELPITAVKPEDIIIESDNPVWNCTLGDLGKQKLLDFEPAIGWKHHIELTNSKNYES